MNDMRLTDTQLAAGLRQIAPSAPPDLYSRILAAAETTRQERQLPGPLGRLTDADPVARRRVVLLAAAALIALGLAAAGVVGALLNQRPPNPLPDLSLSPPVDLPAFVRSTYDLMPQLSPMTITAIENGTIKHKIYVDASGATRIETYASLDAAQPDHIQIYSGTTRGELTTVESRRVWSQQTAGISEDPRVFVFATMGAARSAPQPGCEIAVSSGEVYAGAPARGWAYIGLEYVAGRPTHHVRCGADLWIDVATRVTLRSSTEADGSGQGGRTIEATQVEFGQPDSQLFAMGPPVGAEVIDEAAQACLSDPYCSASPRPVITPRPAPSAAVPAADLELLIAQSLAADQGLPAYEVHVEHWSAKYPGSQLRLRYDGLGRYRSEQTFDTWPDPASIMLVGPGYRYATELTTDGVVFWRDMSGSERGFGYPLHLPAACAGGWRLVGVDVVQERPADHVSCPGVSVPDEYWIDRATHLVLRIQALQDEQMGTQVEEVVELRFVDQPRDLFVLPPGADLRSPEPELRP